MSNYNIYLCADGQVRKYELVEKKYVEFSNPCNSLREGVVCEEGFTANQLNAFVQSNDLLKVFVETNCPGFMDVDNMLIQPTLSIFGEKVEFTFDLVHYDTPGIKLAEKCLLIIDGEQVGDYGYNFALVDVIYAIYGVRNKHPKVRLTKNGVLADGEIVSPFTVLTSVCEIDEDVNLADVFRLAEQQDVLKYFLRFYSWCNPIDDFHKAAKLPLEAKDEFTEKIWYLRIYRWAECYSGYLELTPSFNGVGEIQDRGSYTTKVPDFEMYGIELSPMNELVDLQVVADPRIEIKGKEYNFGYTLLDILDGIYWEISFFGGPEEAAGTLDVLRCQVDEIDREFGESKLDENSGGV